MKRVEQDVASGALEGLGAGDDRPALLVCPMAFGTESEEQYPDVVADYKKKGYGNTIWQTIEDKLYDTHLFQLVTVPSTRVKSVLEQIVAGAASKGKKRLPHRILLCNMNFFEMTSEKLRFGTVARNKEYHVELLLQYYDVEGPYDNVIVPAKGEARGADLLGASNEAADAAVEKLIRRLEDDGLL
jgi:hypothetical protein